MVAMFKKFTYVGGIAEADLLAAFDGSNIVAEGSGRTISDFISDVAEVPIPGAQAIASILNTVGKFVKPTNHQSNVSDNG